MTVRHSLRKSISRLRQQQKMGQNPKAAGSNAAPFRHADHRGYHSLPPSTSSSLGERSASMDGAGSTLYRGVQSQEHPSYEETHRMSLERGSSRISSPPRNESRRLSVTPIPEQLLDLLVSMLSDAEKEDVGEAYHYAQLWPPISKQSLSELDIQNIISNIKLRHDVSFDKDLSFRPNLDGIRGQEKRRAQDIYWRALAAELVLYERLFQGSPLPLVSGHADWTELVRQSQKRIPNLFRTLQEVLKSLVPDRDHSRVDEHLDVSMLMLRIEKGVCDLPRLAEWLASLLKEHCAPMRDYMVDDMVRLIRSGSGEKTAENRAYGIVEGLRELFGILEAMKLDVANHQIRNLKTLLIEDTINFERHYHLDRLINGRGRVNIDAAQRWYSAATNRFRQPCTPQRDAHRFKLEIFVRAVVSTLISNDSRSEIPETFYLDQDRLAQLKLEIDDVIFSNICFDVYEELLGKSGNSSLELQARRRALHTSLLAIVAGGGGYGSSRWMTNVENISLELVRQANGRTQVLNMALTQQVTQHLHTKFLTTFNEHATVIEAPLFSNTLSIIIRQIHSSPMELFSTLVTQPNLPPPPHISVHTPRLFPLASPDTFSPHTEYLNDLCNRLAHILLLHWRTWGPIAYVQEETPNTTLRSPEEELSTSPPPPHTLPPPPVGATAEETVMSLATGETPEPGHKFTAHPTRFP